MNIYIKNYLSKYTKQTDFPFMFRYEETIGI